MIPALWIYDARTMATNPHLVPVFSDHHGNDGKRDGDH